MRSAGCTLRARAIFSTVPSVAERSARSMNDTAVRCSPASAASCSWERSRSIRSDLTRSPKSLTNRPCDTGHRLCPCTHYVYIQNVTYNRPGARTWIRTERSSDLEHFGDLAEPFTPVWPRSAWPDRSRRPCTIPRTPQGRSADRRVRLSRHTNGACRASPPGPAASDQPPHAGL